MAMMRYAHHVLVMTTLACATSSVATHQASRVPEAGFVADEKVQKIAEAYALDAVDFARDNFGLHLDWSDGSVQHIETILTRFHNEIARAKPSEDQILQFSKMFGSYVGEVFRRNHGARWGMVTIGGATVPGMEANKSGSRFWPWGKVQDRLVNGAEDNVWHYYRLLVEQDGHGSPPPFGAGAR